MAYRTAFGVHQEPEWWSVWKVHETAGPPRWLWKGWMWATACQAGKVPDLAFGIYIFDKKGRLFTSSMCIR